MARGILRWSVLWHGLDQLADELIQMVQGVNHRAVRIDPVGGSKQPRTFSPPGSIQWSLIIITGKSPQLSWARTTGTGTLIEKPIDMTKLLDCMKRMLHEPESQRQKRVNVQRALIRLTRPLTNPRQSGVSYFPGGINE